MGPLQKRTWGFKHSPEGGGRGDLKDARYEPTRHVPRVRFPRLTEHPVQLCVLDVKPLRRASEHEDELDAPEGDEGEDDELAQSREGKRAEEQWNSNVFACLMSRIVASVWQAFASWAVIGIGGGRMPPSGWVDGRWLECRSRPNRRTSLRR